jgi:hypothetical protein
LKVTKKPPPTPPATVSRQAKSQTFWKEYKCKERLIRQLKAFAVASLPNDTRHGRAREVYKIAESVTEEVSDLLYTLIDEMVVESAKCLTPQDKFISQALTVQPGGMDYHIYTPEIVLAPGQRPGNKTRPWTHGKIHRDCAFTAEPEMFTISFAFDAVTEENGTVKYWLGSQDLESYRQKDGGERYFKKVGLESKIYTSNVNSAWVWDSRIYHRSIANSTGKDQLKLICGIAPADTTFKFETWEQAGRQPLLTRRQKTNRK